MHDVSCGGECKMRQRMQDFNHDRAEWDRRAVPALRACRLRAVALHILLFGFSAALLNCAPAVAGDWPQWGRENSRNMASPETGLPATVDPGKPSEDGGDTDLATTKNVLWIAKLGSQSYGNPTVSGGRIFVGTNNGSPRQQKVVNDAGVLLCFDESSGKFLWQLACPKLESGNVSDWEGVGLCCSPTIDGDRVYIVTNRCEVMCLTTRGLGAGNEGPFEQEGQYTAGPNKPPLPVGTGDADIVWRYDLRDELGVFPRNMTSNSVLVVGDKLFVATSNSVDWTGKHIPSPDAPALICLDKATGKLLAQERSGISARTFFSNWCPPACGTIAGKPTIIFGGGDGFCYGFDPQPQPSADGAPGTLRELWRCDCNPPALRTKDGKPAKYGGAEGPSEIIATPVLYHDRVYVAIGQEPEDGEGPGCLTCIDATKTGDITQTGKIWSVDRIGRSISTVSIEQGLLYVSEFAGIVHCLDAGSGAELWSHDTEAHIWGSTLAADGKIYVGNETGILTVLAQGKEKKLLSTIDFKEPIYSTPVAANGVLFLATQSRLYALSAGPPPASAGVKITRLDDRLRIEINGQLFTEYYFRDVPRPFLYPIVGPGGVEMTRNWPMKETPGEEHDHPHHRSLWFAHGMVNGQDFWTEGPKTGKIVHDQFLEVSDGRSGLIRATNKWVAADGTVECTDETTLRISSSPDRTIDFDVTLHAPDSPVVFGDTKEGSLGFRLAEPLTMRHKVGGKTLGGDGHYINSNGERDGDAWGKRADWCDAYAALDGKTIGVAIFDHPQNPHHPTWWHARDYGLFAANPFGEHDFEKLKDKDKGALTIPAGQSATFRWRILLHEGDATQAGIAEKYKTYTSTTNR